MISWFRDRVGAKATERIHIELLAQMSAKSFSIAAGLAVEAMLVRSVSSSLSKQGQVSGKAG